MISAINAVVAAEHQADLRRAAEQWRRGHPVELPVELVPEQTPTIALRFAALDEAYRVERLAALDDAPALEGDVLLALSDGEAVAALSLKDGRVVANPFVPTENAVALLRVREKHLSRPRRVRRWRQILRPRFA